jgi:N4-gp56 family major capsid protein
MPDTVVATGLRVQQWDDRFFVEYLQQNLFNKFMGKDENSVIQVKEDLAKKKGDRITYALVNKLTNDAVTGSSTLEGNEEDMVTRSHALTVTKRRNGVRVSEIEEQKSAISLRNAARRTLMDWSMEDTRDLVIKALGSINGLAFADADATARNAWLVDNADRVLFGKLKSNAVSGIHATAMTTLDNTDDKFDATKLSLMKRIALSANPKIKPITVEGGKRFYVCYAGNRTFRDLKNDAVITQAQREVSLTMQNNKLFQGGDIVWDGIIVHEVDDIPVYADLGAGAAVDTSPVFLCGAQALGCGWGKRWRSVTEIFDYQDKYGVAVESIMGIEKLVFGSGSGDTDDLKDHGVVTGWFAAEPDA